MYTGEERALLLCSAMSVVALAFRGGPRAAFTCVPVRQRFATTSAAAARAKLGLPAIFSARELKDAYYQLAKSCHPDAVFGGRTDTDDDDTLRGRQEQTRRFLALSDAYEALQTEDAGTAAFHDVSVDSAMSDRDFRAACQSWLGLEAETVEECKRCPMFREWLSRGGAAPNAWRTFLSSHGGFAPVLRRAQLQLDGSRGAGPLSSSGRRVVRRCDVNFGT